MLCPAKHTYVQVVGRVNQGLDVLELLGDVPCGPDDSPLMRLKVAKCGQTNAEVRGGRGVGADSGTGREVLSKGSVVVACASLDVLYLCVVVVLVDKAAVDSAAAPACARG